jgi:hypothetical protein
MQPTTLQSSRTDHVVGHDVWVVPHHVVTDRLAAGWRQSSADVARDFLSRWSRRLQCDMDVREMGDSQATFVCDLGSICFAGMNETACLLVAGGQDEVKEAVQTFWQRYNSPGRALLIIAVNEAAETAIRAHLPRGRHAVLGPNAAGALLESESPLFSLKGIIRDQVPRRRLIAFDTEHPIEGHMFRGRAHLLDRLLEEESVNFAVAGPGRIGKTSLLRRFLNRVLKSRDGSWPSRFYIDLMPCKDRTPDGLARFIALRIDGSSKVSHLTCDRLEQFLAHQRSQHGRPVDLLLDETDEFLGLETFQSLGNAARKGLCRLVLAGRGNLLRTVLRKESRLHHRIELLRLDPLSDQEAESLFVRPMEDLGFEITNKRRVIEMVLGLTGKLPQYIQYYGRRICELSMESEGRAIGPALVYRVRDEFETMQMFSSPIFEVRDPRARFAGLALLGSGHRAITLPQIQEVLHNQGLPIKLDELWDVANELVIQNVLAWNRGKYQIANESLPYYAHMYDFFGSAMRELKPQLTRPALAS